MTLKDIQLEVRKGELLIIIGDVGSGKSSLLNAIIGDMLYVPQNLIDDFGGLEHEADKESLNALKDEILGPKFKLETKPIRLGGSISYVEQVSWIQN